MKKTQILANEMLAKLCHISSKSSDSKGVLKVQKCLVKMLGNLPLKCRWIPGPKPYASLLEASYQGSARAPRVALVSHADTVDGFERNFQMDLKRGRAIGQGVLDDKGCQVVMLLGLHHFFAQVPQPRISLFMVSSPNEEHGSPGFAKYFQSLSKKVDLALGFEPASESGDIVSSRKGNRWYEITTLGQEAHAGRHVEQGVNAAFELSLKLSKIFLLNDFKKGSTVSVGSLQSSRDVFNVVCGKATAKLDLRFSSFQERERLHQKIVKLLNKQELKPNQRNQVACTTYKIVDDCPPFEFTTHSRPYVQEYLRALEKAEGRTFSSIASGGAADVSQMSRPGLAILDGLGARGGNMHDDKEWIDLSSMVTRAQALTHFLLWLNSQSSR